MVEWMGRNFDVFPGFQEIFAMRNIMLYSVLVANVHSFLEKSLLIPIWVPPYYIEDCRISGQMRPITKTYNPRRIQRFQN